MKMRLLASALVASFAAVPGAQAAELKMMTGPQGGSWIPLGGALKGMWEKDIPGFIAAITSRTVRATTRPASRITRSSAGDLRMIV